MNTNPAKISAHRSAWLGLIGVAALSLGACSSTSTGSVSGSASGLTAEAAPQSGAQQGGRDFVGGGRMGVSGQIAVVKDGLLQVQDSESQTAVTFTNDTTITQEVESSLADVSVGVCIMAMGGGDDSSTALSTISISDPVDGECSLGFGSMPDGLSGEMPEGFTPPAEGERPEGMPSDMPSEMPQSMPQGGSGGFTTGKVTALDGSAITVQSVSMDGGTVSRTVVVDDATRFTKTGQATNDALTVGACVVARGEYEGEQYAAASLAVSDADEDGCSAGFNGGFPGTQRQQ